MAEPPNPVIYFRDVNSKTSDENFDTLEKLIAAKPEQVIQLEETDKGSSVISMNAIGQDNDVAEPVFNSEGLKSIFKQQVGAINEGTTMVVMIPKSVFIKSFNMRAFSRRPNIEPAFHKFGNLGIWFPATSPNETPVLGEDNVYSVDPTNIIGFTLKPPIFEWGVTDVGADFIRATLNFSLGGQDLKWV